MNKPNAKKGGDNQRQLQWVYSLGTIIYAVRIMVTNPIENKKSNVLEDYILIQQMYAYLHTFLKIFIEYHN